ncbi:Por secretion system C-terminal sorting domain-containing protein [Belliella buryatensis]|uniref:Por secretion system C-terminal sorting domain-containing protein n=1 Tax=Belliella buryatensis TaxID=1500549 RepID=A0A239H6E7_9BACT|nr:choice-of-anchor D domain-containing protein [Belliella buryatensis]SNS76989.1 Por secretion system C-terminal sorting domain-containing protein [Belliella buryatensis]
MKKAILLFLWATCWASFSFAQQAELKINPTESRPGDVLNVPLLISDAENIIGFQFDLIFSNSLSYQSFTKATALNNWSVGVGQIGTNTLRVVAVSTNQSPVNFPSTEIINFSFLTKSIPDIKTWEIKEASLINLNQEAITPSIQTGNHTTLSPQAFFPQTDFDLGRVAIGEVTQLNIPIENTGTDRLIIDQIELPFTGLSIVSSLPLQIEAGQNQVITLEAVPASKGLQMGNVLITTNDDAKNIHALNLVATYYAINELTLSSGNSRFGDTYTLDVNLNNTENFSALQFEINLPSEFSLVPNSIRFSRDFQTDHQVMVSQQGNKVTCLVFSSSNALFPIIDEHFLKLDFNVNASPGFYNLRVNNVVAGSSSEEILFSTLREGSVQVTSSIIEIQGNLNFGTIPLGVSQTLELPIKNNGAETLVINDVNLSSVGLTLISEIPFTIDPYSSSPLAFSYTPESLGVFTETVRIKNNSSNNSDQAVIFSAAVSSRNFLSLPVATIDTGEEFKIPLQSSFESEIAALQFDIVSSPIFEMDISAIRLIGSVSQTHQVSISRVNDSRTRFIIVSLANSTIESGVRDLLEIPATFSNAGIYELKFENVTGSDPSGKSVELFVQDGKITVIDEDTTPPAIRVKDIEIRLDEDGNAVISAEDVDNGTTDDVALESIAIDRTTFTCSDLGENIIVFTARDASGNESIAEIKVTVVDEIKPVIQAKSTITLQLDSGGNAGISWEDIDEGSTDNCGIVERILSKSTFTCSDLGEISMTYTVRDASGNESTAEVKVTVVDDLKPVIQAKSTITLQLDSGGNAGLSWEDIDEGSTDNCGIVERILSKTEFTREDNGEQTITYTVKDANGNASVHTITVLINDRSPIIGFPSNLDTETVILGTPKTINLSVNNNGADNLILTAISSSISGLTYIGTVPVTISGNSSKTLTFNYDPEAVGTFSGMIQLTNNSINKPNAEIQLSFQVINGNLLYINPQTVPINQEVNLNVKSNFETELSALQFDLVVAPLATIDVSKIKLLGPVQDSHQISVSRLNESSIRVLVFSLSNRTINIGDKELILIPATFSNAGVYDLKFENVTGSDPSGKSVELFVQYGKITVIDEDTTPPVIRVKDIEIRLDEDGNAVISAEDVDDGTTDDTALESIAIDRTTFTCSDLGENIIVFTARDASGNESTAEVKVTVLDEIKPVVKLKNNYTIQLDSEGKAILKWEDIDEGSTDNCGIVERILSKTEFTRDDNGEQTIIYTVKDASGNEATAEIKVRVDVILSTPTINPEKESDIKLFPNPAKNSLSLDFQKMINPDEFVLEIVDATGRSMGVINTVEYSGKSLRIDTSGLSNGIHFIRISSERSLKVLKFIIER